MYGIISIIKIILHKGNKVEKEPMLKVTFNKLSKELEHLKTVERGEIAHIIDVARELGDLKENAEYHAAKDKQGLMEARILDLTDLVGRAQVIDPSSLAHERISFGSTVELVDQEDDSEITYTIVGAQESDLSKGWISSGSPMARALLGKEEGDEVSIKLPSGNKKFEVESVEAMEL
ncbi:MAG: Transcription elongation factor GreA [uncultured Sulfurovum sp.]|uniref:Transcription elongation factor GreA n=1 Tax=uncultured Sulfurovum sp. TaxID=269237 RepID=A0A6S6STY8_9BACT|nr:MAG: Transcription elongation factor GreA [uncultured Sulfurovum sp.]